MTLGDLSLEREVLRMFLAQASRLLDAIAGEGAEASAIAHTLKGSAHAIGAYGVADRVAALEVALRRGEEPGETLGQLREAVAVAGAAIEAILKKSQ